MKTEITSNVFQTFKCVGGDCPLSCCMGWQIDVDDETYKKYTQLNDEYSKYILDNISTSKKLIRLDRNYCPMLSSEGLCKIQIKYGADYLPDICKSYPRAIIYKKDFLFSDLYLSCPQVVKLVCEKKNFGYDFSDKNNNFFANFFKFFKNKNIKKINYAYYKILKGLEECENAVKTLKTYTRKDINKVVKSFKSKEENPEIIYNVLLEMDDIIGKQKSSNKEIMFLNKSLAISNLSMEEFIMCYKHVKKLFNKTRTKLKNLTTYLFTNAFLRFKNNAGACFAFSIFCFYLFLFKYVYLNKTISKIEVYKLIACISRVIDHSATMKNLNYKTKLFTDETVLQFLQSSY